VIEVFLVKSPKPKPPPNLLKPKPPKAPKVSKKIQSKLKKLPLPKPKVNKDKIKKVHLLKPLSKKKTKIPQKIEDETKPSLEKAKVEHSEEIIKPEKVKENNVKNIQAIITTAIPNYLKNPKPTYPMIARRRGYEGTVVLMVEVLSDGRVGSVKLEKSSGYSCLDKSALKAVKKWMFIPGRKGDTPITMWVSVPIKFELEDRG
jgi:protein TonB